MMRVSAGGWEVRIGYAAVVLVEVFVGVTAAYLGVGSDSSHIYGSNFGDPEDRAADSNRFLGPTLLALYLLISAIVLTNLLIAMVSDERGWLVRPDTLARMCSTFFSMVSLSLALTHCLTLSFLSLLCSLPTSALSPPTPDLAVSQCHCPAALLLTLFLTLTLPLPLSLQFICSVCSHPRAFASSVGLSPLSFYIRSGRILPFNLPCRPIHIHPDRDS